VVVVVVVVVVSLVGVLWNARLIGIFLAMGKGGSTLRS
jgi:hypothetical protein